MKILSKPKGNAEEYGRWSVNPYVGCSHGCLYCYLKKGVWANTLGCNKAQLKSGIINDEHAFYITMAEIIENREQIIKDGGLFMTFTSDPFLRDTRTLFLSIALGCAENGIPVTILTKCGADCVGRKFGNKYNDSLGYKLECDLRRLAYGQIAVGWTLTGHDELEPDASSNSERINAMRGFAESIQTIKLRESVRSSISCEDFSGNVIINPKIWASIEPVIDFLSSLGMIKQALDAGCQHFKIGLLTSNTHVVHKDFQFGEHHFDAYNRDKCIDFIHDVMRLVAAGDGKATVYWKQSFRDFLGEEDFARATVGYNNIVGKDWSMFEKKED